MNVFFIITIILSINRTREYISKIKSRVIYCQGYVPNTDVKFPFEYLALNKFNSVSRTWILMLSV